MAKRILITGGAGFVGSHLADALLDEGHQVRIFDNLAPQVHPQRPPNYLAHGAELLIGDMRDFEALKHALREVEVVFHFAAAVGVGQSMYEIAHYMSANTQGTANLLQAMLESKAQVEKMVVASSMSVYGEGRYMCGGHGKVAPPPRSVKQLLAKQWEMRCPACRQLLTPTSTDESKPLECTSIYALSKRDQEEMTLLFGRTYGLPVVALRFFNIYGTRQALSNPYTGVVAIFASRLLNHRSPMVFEDGQQMRDFVSVHDVVQSCLLAIERSEADGMALNVGSGRPISIGDVASELTRCLDEPLPAETTGKYRAGDIRHCYADISLAQRVLGYRPKYRFAEGIGELVEWLRSQHAEDKAHEMVRELTAYGLTA